LNSRYASVATQLNSYPVANGHRAFEAARFLKVSQYKPFHVHDKDGVLCASPESLIGLATEHYIKFYNQDGLDAPHPWMGDARPLNTPITADQVQDAIRALLNGRASGPDGIYGEYLKYGPAVTNRICTIFNTVFEKHASLPELLDGLLIPLNKPNKSKTVENTRPITLLNIIRKVLSNVVLGMVRPTLEQYISLAQSGFRRNRSTTDVIWSYRWLIAYAQKYQESFAIMGIDLSKAFDCINRRKLMEVIVELVPEDCSRMINYLLSETTLRTRVKTSLGNTFRTNIGTPQGDGLSPLLFIVYLEAAILAFRNQAVPRFFETSYADD
jgi:hypothetical protein